MQEQNSEKLVSLSVKASKMTANVLKNAFKTFLQAQKNKTPKVCKGKQSVRKLMKSGEKLTNIEITDNNIKCFDKIARKYGIDYSLKKDASEDPPRYFVFFKSKDAEVMNSAFKEFVGREMSRDKKPSIIKRIKTISKTLAAARAQERTREKTKHRGQELS